VFDETFPLQDTTAAPSITLTDATGAVLLADVIAPTDFLNVASGSLVAVPGSDRVIWVGLTAKDENAWELVAFDPRAGGADGSAGSQVRVDEGATGALEGLNVRFDHVTALPAAVGVDVPGSDGNVLAQMTTASGGSDVLMLVSSDQPAISLAAGEPVEIGGYQYVFEGRREFAGISVKRDSGAWFIWIATAMLVGGLAITFYVPRRRLWVRLTGQRTQVAALAEKSGGFEKDMRTLATKMGVPIPPELEEER
jgi:cytochrome c biogenesis protein ResB